MPTGRRRRTSATRPRCCRSPKQAGLDRGEAIEALADGRYRQRIASATRDANLLGINAIPAFVLDDRLLLVGAYPHEVFERAFAQLEETEEETGS